MVIFISLNILVYSLENALRSFACLTKGDIIAIKYNERVSGSSSLKAEQLSLVLLQTFSWW